MSRSRTFKRSRGHSTKFLKLSRSSSTEFGTSVTSCSGTSTSQVSMSGHTKRSTGWRWRLRNRSGTADRICDRPLTTSSGACGTESYLRSVGCSVVSGTSLTPNKGNPTNGRNSHRAYFLLRQILHYQIFPFNLHFCWFVFVNIAVQCRFGYPQRLADIFYCI